MENIHNSNLKHTMIQLTPNQHHMEAIFLLS